MICFIFKKTGVFTNDPSEWGYEARTDIKLDAVKDSRWFRIPYPGEIHAIFRMLYLIYDCVRINRATDMKQIYE